MIVIVSFLTQHHPKFTGLKGFLMSTTRYAYKADFLNLSLPLCTISLALPPLLASPASPASLALEASELGEVKIALGRLYREFESFKQSQKTERERDRAELQAWAQTNLI
ncbi:hypothetical protein VF13_42065, partial [Nostoc linckia z16]